jgi:two-component system, OmpR family, sensor histidine kinase CpxA
MSISKLKSFLSSIPVKLFLSFWFVMLSSIFVTRFILVQFHQESVIIEAREDDLNKLSRMANRINNRQAVSPREILRLFSFSEYHGLIFKDVSTGKVITSKKRYTKKLSSYLRKNQITAPTTVQFAHARITGPETVKIANKEYQLFLTSKGKSEHISDFMHHLPTWARIVVPLIISLIICYLFARSLNKPLTKISEHVSAFGKGDFSQRIDTKKYSTPEIKQLASHFNHMAEQIDKNLSAHQRLLGDVSHELRSPLTRLQIVLGLAERSLESPEKMTSLIEKSQLEIDRLDQMLSDILALSRQENRFRTEKKSIFNLAALIAEKLKEVEVLAHDKGISFNIRLEKQSDFSGYADLLSSALLNVLNNAIKYSPDKGKVDVTLTANKSQYQIVISDEGSGVPDKALEHLFKAFYRVDDDRNRTTGGTGLGLSIAQQAVKNNNGHIHAENRDTGGLAIAIELPIANK